MPDILINEPYLLELKKLCIYLYDRHKDIALEKGLTKSSRPVRDGEKFAEVLGYGHGGAYNITNRRTVSKAKYQRMCSKFKQLKDKQSENEEDIKILEAFDELKKTIDHLNKISEEVETKSVIGQFENTKWYIYQRFCDSIGRKLLTFNKIVGQEVMLTIDNRHLNNHPAEGSATVTGGGYFLKIQTIETNALYSLTEQYTIMLNPKAANINMAIGHLTLSNSDYKNVVTKTVILKKTEEKEPSPYYEFPLTPPVELKDGNKNTVKVDLEIFKFLINRRLNRLSSPHRIISTPNDLKKWQAKNREEKIAEINPFSFGKYKIHYKKNPDRDDITSDDFEIRYDEGYDQVRALFTHHTSKRIKQEFRGDIIYSVVTNSLFINLKINTSKSPNRIDNAVFLILNLPLGEEDFTTLTGIISGITDNYVGAIGLLVVAQKVDNFTNPEIEANKEKILNFFKARANQSVIMYAATPVSCIEDLEQGIGQG